jgi:3-oxoacyl-[acyl-carrier protein] reductase
MSGNVLVVGGSGGIGQAVSEVLARAGCDVAVTYHKDAAGAETVADAVRRAGARAEAIQLDVCDASAVRSVLHRVARQFAGLDAMVYCAGITKDGLAVMMSDQQWLDVIAVNLTGFFFCARESARLMMRQRHGSIVAVSSVSGQNGRVGQANYAAAKAGLVAMVKTLAQELGPFQIQVNAVAPGLIDTPMARAVPLNARHAMVAETPLGRLGTVGEVAHAIRFLVTTPGISGSVLSVDGGLGAAEDIGGE